MNEQEQLHQQLLELTYDLLPEDEASALRNRIESEPVVAKAHADVTRQAALLAAAAKLEAPPIKFSAVDAVDAQEDSAASPLRRQGGWARAVHWVATLAACLLLVAAGVTYWRGEVGRTRLADEHLRLVVTGPAALEPGVPQSYEVRTTSLASRAVSAEVEYALYGPQNERLFGDKQRTDASGTLNVRVPADVAIPESARLEVLAVRADNLQRAEVAVTGQPERFATQLSTDKPLYRPGETVYYRSLTLSRFGLSDSREIPLRFEILDPSGAAVAGSQSEGVTDRGVGNGAFEIPGHLAGGEYTLVARTVDGSAPEEKKTFYISRYRLPRLKKELEFVRDSYGPGDTVVADFSAERAEGGAAAEASLSIRALVDESVVYETTAKAGDAGAYQVQFDLPTAIEKGDGQLVVVVDDGGNRETIAKTIPINLGKVDVAFFSEGGDLVPGIENRVYFTARDPIGEPVHIEGRVVDAKGNELAKVETFHEGMGKFTFTPQAAATYRLEITKPDDVSSQPVLPVAGGEQTVLLTTAEGVIGADQSLRATVHATAEQPGLALAAYCRGVQVAGQVVPEGNGAHEILLALPPEVGGVVRLTLFSYAEATPKPIAERLVYRRPAQRLNVRLADHSEAYSPGDSAQMSLMVTDEQGRPVPGVLGVAVVDDALLNLADDKSPRMTTHYLLTTEIEKPEDLEDANFYLSDDEKAHEALDLLLGTQGWRRFAEVTLADLEREGAVDGNGEQIARLAALGGVALPPVRQDNLSAVSQEYRASLAQFDRERSAMLSTVGMVLVAGAILIGVVLLAMALFRALPRIQLGVPAVGAATAALLIGAIWIGQYSGREAMLQGVAMRAETAPATEVESSPFASKAGRFDDLEPQEAMLDQVVSNIAEDTPVAMPEAPPAAMPVPGDNAAGLALGDALKEQQRDLDNFAGKKQLGERFDKRRERFNALLDPQPEEEAINRLEANLKDLDGISNARRALQQAAIAGDHRKVLAMAQEMDRAIAELRFAVREYAHVHQPGAPGVRSDFTETLYWNPLLVADADGRATIRFDLSDSVTTFRVLADAHLSGSTSGRIGSGGGAIISRIPFSLEPKLPLEVTAGDRIELPLAVINDTRDALPVELQITHDGLLALDGETSSRLSLEPKQRARHYYTLNVVGQKGQTKLQFRGETERLADAVEKTIDVVPPGFPVSESHAGRLKGDQELTLTLPKTWVPGSLEVSLQAFPTTLADLQSGVASIIREPYGCFEQASTANYPNVLALDYMQEHRVADPDITRRAREMLEKGYEKLTGYECSTKGYEWFGSDPGHEALTAYGLMEFRDMAEVYEVNRDMIDRTAQWLLSRRDGQGGFERNAKALDSFGQAPKDITDAYIVWALSESGQQGIERELEHVTEVASRSKDPYLIALAAGSLLNAERVTDAKPLLDKLVDLQADDGHLEGIDGSITRSGGQSLQAETTALAALAWLKAPAFRQPANKAIEWITANRQGAGGFGSTQATILALKALLEHAKAGGATVTGGELVVKRDGETLATQSFGKGQHGTITVDGLAEKLQPGENKLVVSLSGENEMPYAFDISYRTEKPNSDDACPVRLTTSLSSDEVKAGHTVGLTATVENTTDKGQPMTIAILGLPAGLEARTEQLDELKKKGTIDYFETRAREVICYWRDLAPKKQVEIKLDLVAEIPGAYTGPASRAYLYYTAEQKQWSEPLRIEVARD